MRLDPNDIERTLVLLARTVLALPGLELEFATSRAEYFPYGPPPDGSDETPRALRRQQEWFLLERPSNALGGVPVEWVLHRLPDLDAPDLDEDTLRGLLASRCSVFQVTGVAEGEGVWVRDLAAMGEYPLSEPEGSLALNPDDVVVGRLFAIGESLYRVSPAAGVFRSGKLLRALLADFEHLREQRRGVLRLTQAELETMFWRRVEPEAADPLDLARTALAAEGLDDARIERIFAELRRTPLTEAPLLLGAGDPLGDVLEDLAFDTQVDLELARRVLQQAWVVLSLPEGGREPTKEEEPAGATNAQAAIEAFDRGRREGRDLETLFRELERDLELETDAYDPDAIDGAPAPDFPGVVAAMVEEFLWETGRVSGEAASREVAVVRAFGDFGADYGVFENLGGRELVLFAAVWLPERRLLKSPDEARRMLAALRAFCAWSQENQDVALLDAYEREVASLERSLPRLVETQRWCRPDKGQASQVFEVTSIEGANPSVRDARGDEFPVELEPRLADVLQPGDRLRARRNGARLDVFCCYPPESAALTR